MEKSYSRCLWKIYNLARVEHCSELITESSRDMKKVFAIGLLNGMKSRSVSFVSKKPLKFVVPVSI